MSDQPCRLPGSNPDDWFIRDDGKQYPDDQLLSVAEKRHAELMVLPIDGESPSDHEDRLADTIRRLGKQAKRKALIRRRRAKESCFSCDARMACLRAAIDMDVPHGTWGGLYEEEIAEVKKLRGRG